MNVFANRAAPVINRTALFLMPAIGAIIGFAGPFESYGTMSLGARIAHFALCSLAIGSMEMFASYYAARRFFQGFWPLGAALCLDMLLTVPAALIVFVSLSVFSPTSAAHIRPYDLLWQNLFLILAFRVGSLFVSWRRIRGGAPLEAEAPSRVPPSELANKMPYGLREEPILALSSEDHYLRVHTPRGEALIHMTMASAAALLDDGIQIHRSHWVARAAVMSATADSVQLVTGLKLPISRGRTREFREWLNNQTRMQARV